MEIEKTSFLMLVATLAAGGAAGYFAGTANILGVPEVRDGVARVPAPPAAAAVATKSPAAPQAPAPTCDDAAGTPGTCPPPSFYSAEEGGCGVLPVKRCNDFKQALKPKVAAQAVECLNALKPYERCDANRLSLCAHAALMNACVEPEGTPSSTAATVANASPGATTSPERAAPPQPQTPASSLAAACDAIVRGCPGTSTRECRATLSGMTEVGRTGAVECMKAHCSDKGLVGCEAVIDSTKTTMVQ